MKNRIKETGKKIINIIAKYNENYSTAMSYVDKYAPMYNHAIYGSGIYTSMFL